MISGPFFLLRRRERIVDESPVPGQQFAYTYDGIGNRTTAEVNGRTSVLSSNTLNQYTQRTVPGAIDVRGRALASAGVVVNEGIATRMDDAFHRAVPIDNSSGPQHPEIRVQALGAGAGPGGADLEAEEIGRVYVPGTPEVYSYDFDGNITGDGRWIYTWDFENRLVGMETVAGAPPSAKRKLEFLYDSESRRIRKRVYDWNGTAYVISSDRRYLYDGWNLMAEIVASPTPFSRTYVWGLDLSGSEQGAGGVGGLLAIQEGGESHYPVYDGNGNVMALVRGSDGGISGRYHYGAFGEVLEVEETGISNPFRFSTKFEDGETGLLYYGFRYYSAETGRWLNRDPIEERGGVNLYGFVGNDGVGSVDSLGLAGGINYPIPGYNVGPWPDSPPSNSPSLSDHFGNDTSPLGQEDWFSENYSEWLRYNRESNTRKINLWIEENPGETPFDGVTTRSEVIPNRGDAITTESGGGNEGLHGDTYRQSFHEADKYGAGQFVIDVRTPIPITYGQPDQNGWASYSWSATQYVEDVVGTKWPDKSFFLYPIAPERRRIRADYKIEGNGRVNLCP